MVPLAIRKQLSLGGALFTGTLFSGALFSGALFTGTLFTGAVSLLAAVPPAAAQVEHTVLVEMFGSIGCPDCSGPRTGLATLEFEEFPVATIEYHAEGPLSFAGSAERAAYYGSPSLPTTVFDGTNEVPGGGAVTDTYRALTESLAATDAPLAIESTYNFNNSAAAGTLNVELEVPPGQSIQNPQDYTIRSVIVENGVLECCGPNDQASWNRVVRDFFEEEPLTVQTGGQLQFFRRVVTVPEAWNPLRLSAIVWIQNDTDRSVLQAVVAADGGGLQPVPITGLDQSRVNLFQNIPNPTEGRARILFTLPSPQPALVTIHDARGRLIRTLTQGDRPTGVHNVWWDGIDRNGVPVPAGMYVYRLQTPIGVEAKKLTLLR